ncbi:MAG: hypothetical protein ABJD07_00985 [Gemmatimonadaceae bacterium]
MRLFTKLLAVLALALGASPLASQQLTRPYLEWRTITTKYFVVHYPAEFAEWTEALAQRLDAEREAVSSLVGSAPAKRVTVLVEDPFSASNGFAIPLLDDPLVFLFPTPPEPSDAIGASRSWPEVLSVHEYAHIAHLTRPSRDPRERRWWRLLPASLSPIAARSPRWVIEGYATYVEGKLTGSGRPHGVWRSAVLRRWALEGQMPRYAQLDGSGEYFGGAMAYLAGSAFLEWLVARGGDSSLVHVWRRMTAVQHRGFADAFAGVFGDAPDVLYGRFVAQLTGDALDVERALAAPPGSAGTIVQHLAQTTGAPALSRDERLLAIELVARSAPSRVVIWAARDSTDTSAVARARQRARSRDPEDVPAVESYPRPKRALATLRHASGAPFQDPRFLPGDRVLLVRDVQTGRGSIVPDLFIWSWRSDELRRVTYGASVRAADPSADGRFAVGQRCVGGRCDLVRIDLERGGLRQLARGSVMGSYSRPRLSPDGRMVAAALQRDGRWQIVLVDAACQTESCAQRLVGPADGASRYDPAFTPDGTAIIVVSELGGIANLERIDLATGVARTLTRVTGAALAPEPALDGGIYFLSLHARGWDLARISADSVGVSGIVALPPRTTSVVPVPVSAVDTFATGGASAPRRYGFGPRGFRVIPSTTYGAFGRFSGVAIANTDPVGRLTLVGQGVLGDSSTWRGASVIAVWRGWLPVLQLEAFYARERPSMQRPLPLGSRELDAELAGGDVIASLDRRYESRAYLLRGGALAGSLRGPSLGHSARTLGFAELGASIRQTVGPTALAASLSMKVDAGRTLDRDWSRAVAGASLAARSPALVVGARLEGTLGRVTTDAPAYERFTVGGVRPPVFDEIMFGQRIPMPALPVGVASGSRMATYRASLTGLAVEPFFWGASAGESIGAWHRAIGAQSVVDVGPFAFVRLPQLRAVAGAAYSLDAPFRHKTRAYIAMGLRP